jgi:alcohol dehydrogenase, propanol-preferring
MVTAGKFPTKIPCTASHEGAGIVKAVGSNVKDFRVGDRVMAGLPKGPCGTCVNCKGPEDWHQYCQNIDGFIGILIDGAFAEYVVVDPGFSVKVPDTLSLISAAPLACAGITVWGGIIRSEVRKGGWLAIVGSGGGLGHLGIQMARAKGINVIGIDARDEGIALSKEVGCEHVFDTRQGQEKVVKEVQALTGGFGVEATVNVSDHETAAALSCAVTRMHGRMIQIAQPDQVSVPMNELIFRDIRIIGSLISSAPAAKDMLDLVAEQNIKIKTNLFHGLSEVPKMVDLALSGKMQGKPVVVVDEDIIAKEKGAVAA